MLKYPSQERHGHIARFEEGLVKESVEFDKSVPPSVGCGRPKSSSEPVHMKSYSREDCLGAQRGVRMSPIGQFGGIFNKTVVCRRLSLSK